MPETFLGGRVALWLGDVRAMLAQMGRRAALIELNPAYAVMARRRIEREWMGEVESEAVKASGRQDEPLLLFVCAEEVAG